MNLNFFLKITIIFIILFTNLYAKNNYFNEGVVFFQKEQLDKAKFKFEQDIVNNPKSEQSYLYLSKIFNLKKEKTLEEQNLSTVILLNPKNEEALFNLSKLKLNSSNYSESKRLIDELLVFCKNYCQKSKKLKSEIEISLKK